MKQEDEYEFDDVDIVNGKLIFKSEKKQENRKFNKFCLVIFMTL